MSNRGSNEVAQRRFWNSLADSPGIISIWSWGGNGPNMRLQTSYDGLYWKTVYTGPELDTGVLPFPPEYKFYRFWRITFDWMTTEQLTECGWNGPFIWIMKPYSEDMSVQGTNYWMRGKDWATANVMIDAVRIPTKMKYLGIANGGCTPPPEETYGFGGGGFLYGYLNDVYYGPNNYGGEKTNVGIGQKKLAKGDFSKTYQGFYGNVGIAAGVTNWGQMYEMSASWTFNLCDRSAAQLSGGVSMSAGTQSVGWGTDFVPIIEEYPTIENKVTRVLTFTLPATPARETMNAYTMSGHQLIPEIDFIPDLCDRTGRRYILQYDPGDECGATYSLIVTYLAISPTLALSRRTAREIDTNVGHNRQGALNDVMGLP